MAIFKIKVFCQSWSIVWDADFSQTRWEVLCPFSLLPDSCNIAACYSNDTAWKIRFPTKQPLPAPTIAWKCPAVDITYCAQRDSKSFFVPTLTQWHGRGHWGVWFLSLMKGPLNIEGERGKAQRQLLWEGNMTPLKWCSVHWVGLTTQPGKGKKVL